MLARPHGGTFLFQPPYCGLQAERRCLRWQPSGCSCVLQSEEQHSNAVLVFLQLHFFQGLNGHEQPHLAPIIPHTPSII